MAAAAAIRLAHELDDPDAVIVVLLPDGGRGYLTKVFNDDWLAQYGFLAHARHGADASATCCAGKDGGLPPLVHTHPHETIAEAVADPARVRRLADAGRPGRAAGDGGRGGRLGGERTLLDALYSGKARLADTVERHMDPPLPSLGAGEPVTKAVELLEERGRPAGAGRRQAGRAC